MALLSVRNLGKSFGSRTLFSEISFEVAAKDHIGLIGANGAGKTTLFQMLLGNVQPDLGEVIRTKLLRVGSLEQTPALLPGQTLYSLVMQVFEPLMQLELELEKVNRQLNQEKEQTRINELVKRQYALQEQYEAQGGLQYQSRARSALLGLGFLEDELEKPASVLSGGQLGKAMLARVLLSGADLLLLDEPTNHLDVWSMEWLENYLRSYAGAYIVISHDRYFLDRVTNRTLEISNTKMFASKGNYTRHLELRASEQETLRRQYYNTRKEIRRIEGIVEQQRRWNRERNIKTAESKLKQIARLESTLVAPEKEVESVRFSFDVRQVPGNDVLIVEDVQKSFGENRLFENVSLHIRAGERVCLLGPNGCGKTTLLHILMGKLAPDSGLHYFGANVEPGYYEQNMRSMQPERTVLEEVWSAYPRRTQTEMRNALAAFLFRAEQVEKKIEMLSGGEKARVQLLKLMLSGSNLLLLDEPTNHLDIASRETLESALEDYGGAMLIVTHDRYLVNRIADRVLYLDKTGLTETIGGYDAFLEAMQQMQSTPQETAKKPKNEYHLKKERQSAYVKTKGESRRLEREIEQLESEKLELELTLAKPEVSCDYQKVAELSKNIEELTKELDDTYKAWEQALLLAEELGEET
ncbi:ATP-binding cassette domain-containing protein [Eubacteriales bacterium OttesenSCG-928-K08]|nr:ATP-binding cassette domain-containing protein [Eubacteriales bacterium OttesenSCG-928-K08]